MARVFPRIRDAATADEGTASVGSALSRPRTSSCPKLEGTKPVAEHVLNTDIRMRRERAQERSCATISKKRAHLFFFQARSSKEEKKNFLSSSLFLPPPSLSLSSLTWLHRANRAQQLELHLFVAAAEPPQDAVACCALGDARRSECGSQQRLHDGQGLPHDCDVCPRQGYLCPCVPQDEHPEGSHRLFEVCVCVGGGQGFFCRGKRRFEDKNRGEWVRKKIKSTAHFSRRHTPSTHSQALRPRGIDSVRRKDQIVGVGGGNWRLEFSGPQKQLVSPPLPRAQASGSGKLGLERSRGRKNPPETSTLTLTLKASSGTPPLSIHRAKRP